MLRCLYLVYPQGLAERCGFFSEVLCVTQSTILETEKVQKAELVKHTVFPVLYKFTSCLQGK